MAAYEDAGAGILPRRILLDADTADLKRAAAGICAFWPRPNLGRRHGRARLRLADHVDSRHSLKEAQGIGMVRRSKNALYRSDRHEFAAEQHTDTVCQRTHHR